MNTGYIYEDIINVIKESQIKLGYSDENFTLYYPLDALNRIAGTNYDIDKMSEVIIAMSILHKETGIFSVNDDGNRIIITVFKTGVKYINDYIKKPFLEDLINCVKKYPCTIDDVLKVFNKYSTCVKCIEEKENDEFEYLVYFEDQNIDRNVFCFHFEMDMASYHRFTRSELEARLGR